MGKMVGAAEFKAKCLKLIEEMQVDGEPVTITKRGRPVAMISPVLEKPEEVDSIIGCMPQSIILFEDPFSPAVDPAEWHANNPDAWEDLL